MVEGKHCYCRPLTGSRSEHEAKLMKIEKGIGIESVREWEGMGIMFYRTFYTVSLIRIKFIIIY